ncbi:CHASE2 domain-containing protein [Thiospirochaeta perfilievii]|uniref:CHASE2 domain-containing protein n=1 Tax=Thiospirochaeta perfilievii TaxID=252967 RepID=A0A5C1QBX6_9SPIO|nr:adenylate/guanylate cyclase domain-containing protein [Thiospirochaeta perfilievii]QEN05585.1 CHASE2 domain-containing protein [Thiospirochaeta perfilievii]
MRKHIVQFIVIPISIVLLLSLATLSPIFEKLEGSIYNAAMLIKEDIEENPDILLVDFGDNAIKTAQVYPVSRDIYADGIFLLKELGSNYTVFDIEFIDPSPVGVDYQVLNRDVPQYIDRQLSSISKNTADLFAAVSSGDIPVKDVKEFIPDLVDMTNSTKDDVVNRIQSIVRNNDIYLGQAARVFGNLFFTINVNPGTDTLDTPQYTFFKDNFSIKNIEVVDDIPELNFTGALPTNLNVSRYSAGAGFTNVLIDEDGVRRKVDLLRSINGTYFAQLSFRPLLNMLGDPDIKLEKDKITLINPIHPTLGQLDKMVIPINTTGSLNINWLPKSYKESFKHIPFDALMNHDKLYNYVIKNLKDRADWGYLNAYTGGTPLLDVVNYIESEKIALFNSKSPDMESYISAKEFLLTELVNFITTDSANTMLAGLEQLKEAGVIDDDNYNTISRDIPSWFNKTQEALTQLMDIREELKDKADNSFAIIGNTATGTTDIGTNPFEKEYMNVGTHANVVNTILNQQYISLMPRLFVLIIALISALLLTVVIRNLPPKRSMIIGIFALVIIIAILALIFRYTSVYIDLLFPALSIVTTFITLTAIRFLSSEKEKSFINKAFSHYLSADVIKEILDDPSKLQLGGESKYMTAMFTDIRAFSTFSEKLSPQDLVRLLNAYLTAMSNTVMDNKGTIDKYEGDAIICFFGAPIYYENHAYKCCYSAVVMKRVEVELNKKFLEDEWTKDVINTRIGINTGDMVVGNMGTDKKMDYTIMGNSVNLAARLEGVNKLYGTWIMVSEETRNQCPDTLLFRRLDRVRVIGIKTPIRLYELIEERSFVTKDELEAYSIFDKALTLFENKEWLEAKKLFNSVLEVLENDSASILYVNRCNDYIKKAPPSDWDGVFKMSSK